LSRKLLKKEITPLELGGATLKVNNWLHSWVAVFSHNWKIKPKSGHSHAI